MKKLILVCYMALMTAFLTTAFAAGPVSNGPYELEKFKSDLLKNVDALGASLDGVLTPDFRLATTGLREIMRTQEYRTCTDSKNDNAKGKKKEAQISACQSVGQMSQDLSARVSAADQKRTAKLRIDENEQALDAFTEAQTRPDRKKAATDAKAFMVESFSTLYAEEKKAAEDHNQNIQDNCYNLPISKAFSCAMEGTLNFLEADMTAKMQRDRTFFAQDLATIHKSVSAYQDEPIAAQSLTGIEIVSMFSGQLVFENLNESLGAVSMSSLIQ